ncbi:MFS transporter, partial [Leuconostoc mesenteroides]|nr:MFS transporter [Leuconostoc mesenteroides]
RNGEYSDALVRDGDRRGVIWYGAEACSNVIFFFFSLTAAAAYAAASVHSLLWIGVFLFLGGMAAGGCNSAGGRLVSGWFPPQQRGLAMGIRQTAQPLGIASGALVIPELAERGVHAGLMFPAVVCTLAAVASVLGIVDPPRKS